MCLSRLHRVVGRPSATELLVEDLEGRLSHASLLAYAGPSSPRVGEWVTVHSGFALQPADSGQAAAVADEVRLARDDGGLRVSRGEEL